TRMKASSTGWLVASSATHASHYAGGARGFHRRSVLRNPAEAFGVSLAAMPSPLLVTFTGCTVGPWRIVRTSAVRGAGLPKASHLTGYEGRDERPPRETQWQLRGVVSHPRYVARREADALGSAQAALGRPEATRAAFIPIRKNEAWWGLAQDERRAIFEER